MYYKRTQIDRKVAAGGNLSSPAFSGVSELFENNLKINVGVTLVIAPLL